MKKQQEKLQELFDESDIEFLFELKKHHPDDEEIDRAIYLNNEVGVGWGTCENLDLEMQYYVLRKHICDKYGIAIN